MLSLDNAMNISDLENFTKKVNNFVKETHSMYPTGTANWGTTTRFKIDKRGDLLNSLYFVAKLPKLDTSLPVISIV